MLGAAASSSAEAFWSSLRNQTPRSQSAAAPRLLEAAHDLGEKTSDVRFHLLLITKWEQFKKEGKKNLEQLRKTPHWKRRQPPGSLRNIWPTETKMSSPGLSPHTEQLLTCVTQSWWTFHLRNVTLGEAAALSMGTLGIFSIFGSLFHSLRKKRR